MQPSLPLNDKQELLFNFIRIYSVGTFLEPELWLLISHNYSKWSILCTVNIIFSGRISKRIMVNLLIWFFFLSRISVKLKRNLKIRNEKTWLVTLVKTNGLHCLAFSLRDIIKESLSTHNERHVPPNILLFIKVTLWGSFPWI